jgi:filamentous hemagglutinin family protein
VIKKLFTFLQRYTVLCTILLSQDVWAEVITDGSMGIKTSLVGQDYAIPADIGKLKGDNLFHSFEMFNLQVNETATFSGPSQVKNIIARITGGQSIIDGAIRSVIPDANLYLANPDGFVFKDNSSLDILGSFYSTTASNIFFSDGTQWSTHSAHEAILTAAPPSAFGFLNTPQTIEISNTQLSTPTDQVLSFSAGDIFINNSRLKANSGHLDLLAMRHATRIQPTSAIISHTDTLGQINISDSSSLDIGREGEGSIFIRAGHFVLDDSDIFVNTSQVGQRSTLFIGTNSLLFNDADIDSRTYGAGQGGLIVVQVIDDATLINTDILTTGTQKQPEITGDAGDISLVAENITLSNTTITTKTYGIGKGGNINIVAQKNMYMDSPNTGLALLPSIIQASTDGGGDAGTIYIEARNLTLTGDKTAIDNNSKGLGNGGSIQLHIADVLSLSDGAFISADSEAKGNAGNISINTSELHLQSSYISTAATESDGGNIILNIRSVLNVANSSISANINGDGRGNGGNLAIANPCIFDMQNSQLRANASFGNGGLILAISGADNDFTDNNIIDASSEFGSDGSVQIDIPNVDRSTLPMEFLDASIKIKRRCIARTDDNVSRFTVKKKNNVPNVPDDFQSIIPLFTDELNIK